jgi:membrane protease YdiL (CAAX protease family)
LTAPLLSCHLLAAYLLAAVPVIGFFRYRKAKERMQTGEATDKVRFLRELVARQLVNTCFVGGLLLFGGVPGGKLGLGAPSSWWRTGVLSAAVAIFLVGSGLRLRAKSGEIRRKLGERAEALIPDSIVERRWFVVVCIGGGIFEELAYRGFLFYYLGLVLPPINGVEKALVTSLLFGVGHLYQGWKGVLSTGMAGLVMASLYLVGGNLLLPVVAHTLANMRALLIFPARAATP